ncbi:hypothetical protein [Mycolicibacterium insubricum]|uniref:hypothetical protein n=1 Tax=Mycolicibacterium insubricum TaxID=444597 RepID=UPI0009F42888|nr:hypothetical protein [Mycolicibacterium insubricum]MCV7080129.1 hypothetical protein [Mycolicibacterium insubricum]
MGKRSTKKVARRRARLARRTPETVVGVDWPPVIPPLWDPAPECGYDDAADLEDWVPLPPDHEWPALDPDLEALLLGRGWVLATHAGDCDFYDWPASEHDFGDTELEISAMTYIGVMIPESESEELHYDVHHVGPEVGSSRSYTDRAALIADLDDIEAVRYVPGGQ